MLLRFYFDVVCRADGEAAVVMREDSGAYEALLLRLQALDRRRRCLVLLRSGPQFPGGMEDVSFFAESIIVGLRRAVEMWSGADARYIYWVVEDSNGRLDCIAATFERGELEHIEWMPVVMPPHEPRSLQALGALFPGVLEQISLAKRAPPCLPISLDSSRS